MTDKPSCQSYRMDISAMVDNELTESEQTTLNAHMETCRSCRDSFTSMTALTDAVRASALDVPEELHDKIMARIRDEQKAQASASGKVIRFVKRYGAIAAAAMVALAILSPTVLDGIKSMDKLTDARSGASAMMADVTEESAPAAATTAMAATNAAGYFAYSINETEAYQQKSASPAAAALAAGSGTDCAAVYHDIDPDETLSVTLPGGSYSGVLVLDTAPEKTDTLPQSVAEVLQNLTQGDGYQFAILTVEDADELLMKMAKEQSLPPVRVYIDASKYDFLTRESPEVLFVLLSK